MSTNFITPMNTVGSLSSLGGIGQQNKTKGADGADLFKDMFSGMVEDVQKTESDLVEKQYLLATGQIDDAHTVPAAAAQAQLSVDMLVQIRNKALDAYNELMRTSL